MKSPKPAKPTLVRFKSEPSWPIKSSRASAFVTRTGGQVGPVTFMLDGRKISPMHVAPWAGERPRPTPEMIAVLRGDFFCMPFGGNDKPYRGERYPAHGETANSKWKFESLDDAGGPTLHLSLRTVARAGRVDKYIHLRDGHAAVYSRHVISQMRGPMCIGQHAMLDFPDQPGSGLIATSPTKFMQTFPGQFERPEQGGYTLLEPGRDFRRLDAVPISTGGTVDLSAYPTRRGFEELVMLASVDDGPLAWTAVTFPSQRFVWFALKDPRVLHSTVLWFSNGGRHYAPWSSRHINVMGLEEVTANFHFGLAESAAPNNISRRGHPTCVQLRPDRPLVVNYIFGIAAIPAGFGRVSRLDPDNGHIVLRDSNGRTARAPIDVGYLSGSPAR